VKLILGLAGLTLPIAGITYEIRRNLKESEKNTLKRAIEYYEAACPNIKKLYDELDSAIKLRKSIPEYNDSDPKFNEIRSKIATAKANWENKTGVTPIEKLATICYGEKNLDLIQAHDLLDKLKEEKSYLNNTLVKVSLANNVCRIFESIMF